MNNPVCTSHWVFPEAQRERHLRVLLFKHYSHTTPDAKSSACDKLRRKLLWFTAKTLATRLPQETPRHLPPRQASAHRRSAPDLPPAPSDAYPKPGILPPRRTGRPPPRSFSS